MSSLYSNRNYHFSHNKLSENNPFNMGVYNQYQQKNSSVPKQTPKKMIQNPINNSPQNYQKNSLYNPANAANQFISNINVAPSMNYQDRINVYGQDAEENYFKRSLRKPTVSNAIQSSSYGIINNIPKSVNLGRYENVYSQRRDHVADLLNYTAGTKNNYSYNYGANTRFSPYNQNQSESKVCEIYPNDKTNIIERRTPIQAANNILSIGTPNNNISAIKTANEKISNNNLSEYTEKNATAVIEYSYKEDPNSRFRNYMEDKGKAIDCFNNDANSALFCLFDGHGGGEVSKFLQENFHEEFKHIVPNNNNLESSIITLFDDLDQKIKNSNFFHVGSTACMVYITRENGKRILYCANIGDTRCILLNSFQAKRLSYDDRASDKNEYDRIINSGGIVFAGRVYGQLMLSRAFGDWELKPYGVINVPHVLRMEIAENDHYIVMASDGIWDVFSDEDVFKMSLSCTGAEDLCKNIIKDALIKGTMDNISCFVVRLN